MYTIMHIDIHFKLELDSRCKYMQHVSTLEIHIFSTICAMDDWHPKRERLRNGAALGCCRWLQL